MKETIYPTAETASTRFFRKLDWSAFWTAFAICFAVYAYTCAPSVTLEDSGELSTGSANLGVPHPPGYPIWTIVTWCFTKIFFFVQFRGQPNPAWSVALCSAFWGALATGFTAILVCRSGTDMLRSLKRTTEVIGTTTENVICWTAGVSGSLIFAFSPVNWSQSVIAEVYSLNAFLLVLVMFLIYVWMRCPDEPLPYVVGLICLIGAVSFLVMSGLVIRNIFAFPNDFLSVNIHYLLAMLLGLALIGAMIYVWKKHPIHRILYLTSFVFGIGLTNYQVLLLLMVSLAFVVFLKSLPLFRDFVIAAVPYFVVYLLIKRGILPFSHPTDAWTYTYVILNFVVLGLVYAFLPNGKAVAPSVLCMLLGLAVYGYMPMASDTNPPINWGYPRTWEGFVHAITRGQYEKIVPTDVFSMQFVRQLGDYFRDLRGTFTLPIAIIAFLPFTAWNVAWGERRFRVIYLSLAAAILAVVLILAEEVLTPTLGQIAILSIPYRVMIAGIIILAVCGGLIMVFNEIRDVFRRLFTRSREAGGKASAPSVVDMDMGADAQKWSLVIFSGFLVMSVVLVLLASPKGDIQDEFIQRVKFISSHALYAFWIGYGLALGLAVVDTVMRGNRLITWSGIAAAMLLPAIPILDNAYNKEMLRVNGGAEQNGHDYGWQFGNYQLRGAQAISEELSPDEEPLPNPAFPPEMGPRAVFFGGTDPGRFVPTYMIYSAKVRPDVFLITQNALADNTYMQVMRDLMGNDIYIPSQEDSAKAFQRYVEEVRSGRRPANAELKIEGGRVQVSGALGVMEINGILAQMIFERNNYKHEFFVEESYVIQWMYPYLTPNGLIMKINPNPATLSDEVVRNDMDFWDWYTRRLHDDTKFIRDVCARKSFSKLRSAIGGMYARQGRPGEAEQAFQQARVLYPLSPEANFRIVQEVLMPQSRFTESEEIMAEFGRQDPGNDRVPEFTAHLGRLGGLKKRVNELESQRGEGKMDAAAAIELTECYLQLQRRGEFNAMVAGILSSSNLPAPFYYRTATLLHEAKEFTMLGRALDICGGMLPTNSPPEVYLNIARMYYEAKRPDKMAEYLQEYVKRQPTDWKAWMDVASARLLLGQTNGAVQALIQARTYGGDEAVSTMGQDERFIPILSRVAAATRNLMNIPGLIPPGASPSPRQPYP